MHETEAFRPLTETRKPNADDLGQPPVLPALLGVGDAGLPGAPVGARAECRFQAPPHAREPRRPPPMACVSVKPCCEIAEPRKPRRQLVVRRLPARSRIECSAKKRLRIRFGREFEQLRPVARRNDGGNRQPLFAQRCHPSELGPDLVTRLDSGPIDPHDHRIRAALILHAKRPVLGQGKGGQRGFGGKAVALGHPPAEVERLRRRGMVDQHRTRVRPGS